MEVDQIDAENNSIILYFINLFIFYYLGEPNQKISVNLKSASTECSFDYLHFHDGNSTFHSPLIASLSGEYNDIHISSTGNEVSRGNFQMEIFYTFTHSMISFYSCIVGMIL